MKKYTLVLLASMLVFSCKKSSTSKHRYTIVETDLKDQKTYTKSLFSEVKLVFFETRDSSLIGARPEIKLNKDMYFIGSNNTIVVFGTDGAFLRTIDHRGNGAGEYINVSDFTIYNEQKRIEVLDKPQKKVIKYDYEGNFIEDTSLDFWAIKIFRKEDVLYTYSGNQSDAENAFKFCIIDKNNKEFYHRIDEHKSRYLHVMSSANFHENKKINALVFAEPFNDTIYALDQKQITPKYYISYNGRNIPKSFYKDNRFSNVMAFFQEFHKHNYVNSTYNVLETHKYLYFKSIIGENRYLSVYDKARLKCNSYNEIIDNMLTNNIQLPFQDEEFVFWSNDNQVLFLLPPTWFIDNQKNVIDNSLKEKIKQLKKDDNPIGVLCTLK